MKEEINMKKFSIWDSSVLLILVLISFPFILSLVEGIAQGNYYNIFIYLLLFGLALFGIIKYVKKLFAVIKNPETKKRGIIMGLILVICSVLFALRTFGIL